MIRSWIWTRMLVPQDAIVGGAAYLPPAPRTTPDLPRFDMLPTLIPLGLAACFLRVD
jgi:hypothetical protein